MYLGEDPTITPTLEVPEVEDPKKPRVSTYLMAAGVGLFLIGNLGMWIVKGSQEKKKFETFGKVVAISGLIVRGVAEAIEFKKKVA